jgi:hypothetical protein
MTSGQSKVKQCDLEMPALNVITIFINCGKQDVCVMSFQASIQVNYNKCLTSMAIHISTIAVFEGTASDDDCVSDKTETI